MPHQGRRRRNRIGKIVKSLDPKDQEQVLALAERLADSGPTAKRNGGSRSDTGHPLYPAGTSDEEIRAEQGSPSYIEAAGDDPADYR